jgi:DNA polymerase-3 subunit gamma/tau
VRAALGAGASETVIQVTDALAKGDMAQGLGAINTAVDEGADPRQFARQMVEHLRALLLMRLESGVVPAHVSEDLRPRLEAQAAALSPRALARAVRLFNQAAVEAKGGWQPQLPLEMAFIEAALPPESEGPASRPPSARDVPRTLPPARHSTSPSAKSRPAPTRSVPSSPSPSTATVREPEPTYDRPAPGDGLLTPETLRSRWSEFLNALRPRNLSLEALMRSCEPVAVEGDVVSLEFAHNFHRSKVEEEHNKRLIEDVLSTLIGQRYRVRCVLVRQERAVTPPQRPVSKSAGEEATPSAEQIIAEDPVVRTAVEDLGAQIVGRRE